MLGDGVVSDANAEMRVQMERLAQLEIELKEFQRALQDKADEVFNLKWDMFLHCEHDWMLDRDQLLRYPECPKLCTRCNMYDHGPRKQFF